MNDSRANDTATPSDDDDDAAIATLVRRADADIAAGRLIGNNSVFDWLCNWGEGSSEQPSAVGVIVWTQGAVTDLDRIRSYLSAVNREAAGRLGDRIAAVTARLSAMSGERHERAITYPYLLHYRGGNDALIVDAIRHASDARIV